MEIKSIKDMFHELSMDARNEDLSRSRYSAFWHHGQNRLALEADDHVGHTESFLEDISTTIRDCNDAVSDLVDVVSELIYLFELRGMAVKIPRQSMTAEMNEWLCSDIFTGKVGVVQINGGFVVIFDDDTDATHFKMRWG